MDLPTIYVTGTLLKFEQSGGIMFAGYQDEGTGVEPNPTLSPDGGGGEVIYIDEPNSCPADSPENVSREELHAAAAAATRLIQNGNYREWEYGVIIFESDGKVGFTPPFTQGLPNDIDWNDGIPSVPDGARVLGLLHGHPDQANIDDTYPTRIDWDAYEQFRSLSGSQRGITGDPNMLNYIATSPYSSLKTYVYDKNDKDTRQTGCRLQ